MTPISEVYRSKAAELLRRAEAPTAGAHRCHWILMAAQWADLARRVEAEDRVIQNYAPED